MIRISSGIMSLSINNRTTRNDATKAVRHLEIKFIKTLDVYCLNKDDDEY
jgi:hypothetical protein